MSPILVPLEQPVFDNRFSNAQLYPINFGGRQSKTYQGWWQSRVSTQPILKPILNWIELGQSKQNDYSLLFFESKTYKNESQEDSAWTNILKAAESKFLSFFLKTSRSKLPWRFASAGWFLKTSFELKQIMIVVSGAKKINVVPGISS